MNKGDIEAEYERQVKRIQEAKGVMLKQEDLKAQMEDFSQVSRTFTSDWPVWMLAINKGFKGFCFFPL